MDAAEESARTGKADPAAQKARDQVAVRKALEAAPVAVLLLGGAHDLAEEVRQQGQGQVGYPRVEVAAYRRLMGSGGVTCPRPALPSLSPL